MQEFVQVKAKIPTDVKRQAFAAFALQDEKFNRWLERELRAFIHARALRSLPSRPRREAEEAGAWTEE